MRPEAGAAAAVALRELALSSGDAVPCAHNQPMVIDDARFAWYVENGAVNVFVREYRDGAADSSPEQVVHAEVGRLLFGVAAVPDNDLRTVVRGVPGTRLRAIPLARLGAGRLPSGDTYEAPGTEHARNEADIAKEAIRQGDLWIGELAAAVARRVEAHPPAVAKLAPGTSPTAGILTADRGVVWLVAEHLEATFLGTEPAAPDGLGAMPVTPSTWVDMPGDAEASVMTSAELAREVGVGRWLDTALADFNRLAIGALDFYRRLELADILNLRRESAAWRRRHEGRARRSLYASVLGGEHDEVDRFPLAAAMRAVARYERVEVRVPGDIRSGEEPPGLQDILDFSGLRGRRVKLDPRDRWWSGDSGAMLAFRSQDGRPVALLPAALGRYRLFDPAGGGLRVVAAGRADEVGEEAWQIYPPAPPAATGFLGLFGIVRSGLARDLGQLVGAGALAGLLTIVPAVAIGWLIERAAPVGAVAPAVMLALTVAGLAVLAALANALRGTAAMRIEGRVAARVGAALLDSVLRTQLDSLKRFSTGDLGMRVMAFQRLRDVLAGTASSALLSTLFLLPALGAVFLYDAALGWPLLVIAMVSAVAIAGAAAVQSDSNHRHFEASRRVAGELLQTISGIAKLRAMRSEGAAIAAWARLYREQKQTEARLCRVNEHVIALGAALPSIAAFAIIATVVFAEPARFTLSDILVVFALSLAFFASIALVGREVESIAATSPSFEQARPLLAAPRERSARGGGRLRLTGELLFDRVSFRYGRDGPETLSDVTIRAAPGEFIAIVGPSGAGKSTLVRLALGLEQPLSGGVYYDQHNLARIDPASVRRQIGVVLQENTLQPGSLLSNIIGMSPDLTIRDAWRAARIARLESDIRAMPLGMHTPVAENGSTLSGGQRQRVAIAAALVRSPRIVILDEATSWLDSATQQEIMAGVESSATTRIVVAHRLTTTRKANRIFVLDSGRVVQEGTYEELSSVEGTFLDLIRRQVVQNG